MITFVTSNRHKFEEVSAIFNDAGIELSWEQMKYEEIQADTTEEVSRNSCIKLIGQIHGDFFIEDTGLFIDSLKGFPGVYSSYVQKTIGNDGIIRLLKDRPDNAMFKTVLTAYINGTIKQFTGILEGSIASGERGEGGFGYDPVFIPSGYGKTLSEMDLTEKNRVSHRFRAVKGLVESLARNDH